MDKFNNWLYSLPYYVTFSVMFLVSFIGFWSVVVTLFLVRHYTEIPLYVLVLTLTLGVPTCVVLWYFMFNKKG